MCSSSGNLGKEAKRKKFKSTMAERNHDRNSDSSASGISISREEEEETRGQVTQISFLAVSCLTSPLGYH
jgi:hypothetical protein